MSKKLKAALMADVVSVRNRTSGEIRIHYLDENMKQRYTTVGPFVTMELVPRLTSAALLEKSNLDALVKTGSAEIK